MPPNLEKRDSDYKPAGGYKSFDTKTKAITLSSHNRTVDKFSSIQTAKAASNDVLGLNVTSTISSRAPFTRFDYETQRPNESLPIRFRDVVHACRATYLRVGIVRNVIDMMTDFASEGLKIVHTDKKIEAFFRVWTQKVDLKEAITEFIRHFLLDGNVVIKRDTARLTKPVETQWMNKTVAVDKLYVQDGLSDREIPWKYTFLNVCALYWTGGDLAKMQGNKQLAFRVSQALLDAIRSPSGPFQDQIIDKLPIDIQKLGKKSATDLVELDMDHIYVAHNKKDSWEDWAPPFLYSILSEIQFRDKLRQAEVSALDGVINVIRLWKLGDHKEGILPDSGAVDKLIGILEANTGGGAMDIVWDSMISMEPHYPPIDKILGSEKYQQVNRDILIGLGVPEVLIGGEGANFSNSYIQLKTLVEKLEYVRGALYDWITSEIALVCDAMGIDALPRIRFNEMNLEDESINRKLIVGLLDRGVISAEAVLEVYGEDYLLEVDRIKEQKKLFKQTKIEIKSPFDKTDKLGPNGDSGPSGGRPGSTEDVSRDSRTPNPKRASTSAELTMFALDALDAIDEYLIPLYMDDLNVANARKLTSEQKDELNIVRMTVLACIKPLDDISKEGILSIAGNADKVDVNIVKAIGNAVSEFTAKNGSVPTLNQRKRLEAVTWASVIGE